jgi:hypothetical protein
LAQFDSENKGDFIPIDDAVQEFGVSRRTLFRLAQDGRLSKHKRVGDKRTFVRRVEVQSALGFREVPAKYDADSSQS